MLPTGTANDQGKSFGLGAGEVDLRAQRARASPTDARRASTSAACVALDAAGAVVRDDWFFDSRGLGHQPARAVAAQRGSQGHRRHPACVRDV